MTGELIGQLIGLYLWCMTHEMMHKEASRGPRIVKFLNRTVGRWQNHLALWVTLIALPGFWFIRLMEIIDSQCRWVRWLTVPHAETPAMFITMSMLGWAAWMSAANAATCS